MGLFDKTPVYCAVCEKETGTAESKKHKIKDGHICDECFRLAGYTPGCVCFADTSAALKERINTAAKYESELTGFNTNIEGLLLDTVNKRWTYKLSRFTLTSFVEIAGAHPVYSFDDVADCSLVIDEEVIGSVKKSGVGRALVGGILFGGVGAIVGATTGKETITQRTVQKYAQIKVTLTNFETVTLPLFAKEIFGSHNVIGYCGSLKESGEKMMAAFRVMIEGSKAEPIKSASAADEIRKYKSLLDDGIISAEEFEAKKQDLLNT